MKPQLEPVTDTLLKRVVTELSRNQSVRVKLPGWGRVHIDRQLPFLCVYRRPSQHDDPGTEKLLLGEASYLLADARPQWHAVLSQIIAAIIATQIKAFGNFLLLELWSGKPTETDSRAPRFRIMAPSYGSPAALLEDLENALLEVKFHNYRAHVAIDYREYCGAPGLMPLLSEDDRRQLGCVWLGLEVQPVYRDALTGSLFPNILRVLHRSVARALKRAFYAFAHAHTRYRPAHFHQLGRRAMTTAVWKTDQQLAAISSGFDLLLHVSPVNAAAAWSAFQRTRFQRKPEFLYRPRPIDVGLLKRRLFDIPLECIEDPTLADIFSHKRDELDRQITLLADRNSQRFLLGSRQLFGDPDPDLLELARTLLAQLPVHHAGNRAGTSLDATHLAAKASARIAAYRARDPSLNAVVEIRDDVPGVLVSQGNFLIGKDALVVPNRIEAILAHEIDTHVLTYHNGRQQPLHELYAGMANYEATQEGLAVISEYLVGGLNNPRLRLLAGRVMAVHLITSGADFVQTFRELHQHYGFEAFMAFTLTMRVFRGGGYTKDAVYLSGLVKVLEQLSAGQDLDNLYLGKIALEHLPLIEELCWREILKPPRLQPLLLEQPDARKRLARLRQGLSVAELSQEIH